MTKRSSFVYADFRPVKTFCAVYIRVTTTPSTLHLSGAGSFGLASGGWFFWPWWYEVRGGCSCCIRHPRHLHFLNKAVARGHCSSRHSKFGTVTALVVAWMLSVAVAPLRHATTVVLPRAVGGMGAPRTRNIIEAVCSRSRCGGNAGSCCIA
jgi:hypothetical protein